MTSTILIDGDEAVFRPFLMGAMVFPPVLKKGPIKAKGTLRFHDSKICIAGDEKSVEVKNCKYVAPPFIQPGSGTLTITKLNPAHTAKGTFNSGKATLLKGKPSHFFTSKFTVAAGKAAKLPSPANTPDPRLFYLGQGYFKSKKNKKNLLGT